MSRFVKISEAVMLPIYDFLATHFGNVKWEPSFCSGLHSCSEPEGIGARFALSFGKDNEVSPGTWQIASVPRESTAFQAGVYPSDTLLQVCTPSKPVAGSFLCR